MIIFNHVTAAHLVNYTQRLAQIGVATAVLPNEGILYDPDVLNFNAGKYHNGANIDLFFCWNEPHKQALLLTGFDGRTRIEVVGVPRFDYYFKPWCNTFPKAASSGDGKPNILFCTNFGFAKFLDLPRARADHFFEGYVNAIPSYRDYWGMVEANHASQRQCIGFLDKLVAAGKYAITLRPHPNENLAIYKKWIDALPAAQRGGIFFDSESNITQLILNCDLEISCETCTTALEAWIVGKPTIELVLQKHPLFYHRDIAEINMSCDTPDTLSGLVDSQLAHGVPELKQEKRAAHLAKWCNSPSGGSASAMARAIAETLAKRPQPNWRKLDLTDIRRGMKLALLRKMGLPYHFAPLLWAKYRLNSGKYAIKHQAYRKSITPRDVAKARLRLEQGIAMSYSESSATPTTL